MINVIDFVFNIINLGIIIFIIIYIFKKYLLFSVKESIEKQNQDLADLKIKLKSLCEKQGQVAQEIINQEEECQKLVLKINKWKEFVNNTKNQKELDRKKSIEEFEEKLTKQYDNYKVKRLSDQVIPELTLKLKHDYELFFSDDTNSNKYFNNIIDQLNKKSI